MAEKITCRCGKSWHPVPGIAKAHQGDRTPTTMVRVPDEDVYGRVHGYVDRPSSRWVSTGPSAPMRLENRSPWDCDCGARCYLVTTRTYLVTCQHGVRPGMKATMCSVAAIRKNPPSDLYVNARYGGACPCCGHQGTHWVQWGQTAPCGAGPQ